MHERPERHKKRFALVVSGVFTLLIFTFWSMATFGVGDTISLQEVEAERAHQETSPFESLYSSAVSGFEDILSNVSLIKGAVEKVDLNEGYTEMRDNVLEVYVP